MMHRSVWIGCWFFVRINSRSGAPALGETPKLEQKSQYGRAQSNRSRVQRLPILLVYHRKIGWKKYIHLVFDTIAVLKRLIITRLQRAILLEPFRSHFPATSGAKKGGVEHQKFAKPSIIVMLYQQPNETQRIILSAQTGMTSVWNW
jgi:hypothetical protein